MSRILATYPLKFPIIRETRDAQGQEREEVLREAGFNVVLRRPRAKDMRVLDDHPNEEIGGAMAMVTRISNLSEEEVELLDGEDLGELGNLLSEVSANGPKTGTTA